MLFVLDFCRRNTVRVIPFVRCLSRCASTTFIRAISNRWICTATQFPSLLQLFIALFRHLKMSLPTPNSSLRSTSIPVHTLSAALSLPARMTKLRPRLTAGSSTILRSSRRGSSTCQPTSPILSPMLQFYESRNQLQTQLNSVLVFIINTNKKNLQGYPFLANFYKNFSNFQNKDWLIRLSFPCENQS